MGARAGRKGLYPNIDFCIDPEATCASGNSEELRWTTALFEWSERVQRYNDTGWASYEEELFKFVDGGMGDDNFISSVSRIFARGCHAAGCSDVEPRMAIERKDNFNMILNDVFDIDAIEKETEDPTPMPTPKPQVIPPSLLNPSPPTTGPTEETFNTPKPTQQPADACDQDAVLSESRDCPNPCPSGYSGFEAKPGTQCGKYVQCNNGQVVGDLLCPDDTTFSFNDQYCEPSDETVCCLTPCGERMPATPSTTQQKQTPAPMQQPPSMPPQQPPTLRPTFSTISTIPPYALPTPRPTIETPRPTIATPQPSADSNEQRETTYEPTYSDGTIIGLEDNGGEKLAVFKHMHAICWAAMLLAWECKKLQ